MKLDVLALNTAFLGTSVSLGIRTRINVTNVATATTTVPKFLCVRWEIMQETTANIQIAATTNRPIPTPNTRTVMT